MGKNEDFMAILWQKSLSHILGIAEIVSEKCSTDSGAGHCSENEIVYGSMGPLRETQTEREEKRA